MLQQQQLSGRKNQSGNQPERRVLRQRGAAKTRRQRERAKKGGAPLSLQQFDKSYYFIISSWAWSWAGIHVHKHTPMHAYIQYTLRKARERERIQIKHILMKGIWKTGHRALKVAQLPLLPKSSSISTHSNTCSCSPDREVAASAWML